MAQKKVLFIVAGLTDYRVPFHQALHRFLAEQDICYEIALSPPKSSEKGKGGFATLPFSFPLKEFRLTLGSGGGTRDIIYQRAFVKSLSYDLVIVIQENKYLLNYLYILTRLLTGKRIAFFGHGKNFQSSASGQTSVRQKFQDRWKRFWVTRVHWWFAYTKGVSHILEKTGFPHDHITVFNNAIDTGTIKDQISAITLDEIQGLRAEMGISSDNIGIFIGGMYQEKRLGFLIEAALLIRKDIPDFHLVLVGSGTQAYMAEQAAEQHDFISYAGAQFGLDKTRLAMMAKVFLMPGLVGLAVLDSFAYGLPMITTNLSYHSPEIDYLEDGQNGIIVKDSENLDAYAKVVAELLKDETKRQDMIMAGQKSAQDYTIENMAQKFGAGVVQALKDL